MKRGMASVVTGSVGLMSLLAVLFSGVGFTASAAPPEATKGGYSIFDETIVDMTWPEVEKAAKEGAVVLLPTAVIEEHGPHMALGVDTYLGYLKCKLARRELERRSVKTVIAPPFYWGINICTGSFPGSFHSRPEVVKGVLGDELASFKRWGFNRVFVLNWHGDYLHNVSILEAIKEARIATGIEAYYVTSAFFAGRLGLTGKEDHVIIEASAPLAGPPPKFLEVHADKGETALMAYYFPGLVDTATAKTLKSTDLTAKELATWRKGWETARKVTPLGYFGDPASFEKEDAQKSAEDGARIAADVIEAFVKGNYKPPVRP